MGLPHHPMPTSLKVDSKGMGRPNRWAEPGVALTGCRLEFSNL